MNSNSVGAAQMGKPSVSRRILLSNALRAGILPALCRYAGASPAWAAASDQGVGPADLALPLCGWSPSPLGLAITPDGKRAYVPFDLEDVVLEVDLTIPAISAGIDVSGAGIMLGSGKAVLTPDGRRLFVTNFGTQNVMVIDTASRKLLAVLPIASVWLDCMNPSPDGTKVYLWETDLFLVSTADNSFRRVIVPDVAFRLVAPSRKNPELLYCAGVGRPPPGNQPVFFTFNLRSESVTRKITLPATVWHDGAGGRLRISAAEDKAYLSWWEWRDDRGVGNLSIIDLATFDVLFSTPMENGVGDFALDEDAGKLYTAGVWSGGSAPNALPLIELDLKSRTASHKMMLSPFGGPSAMEMDPAGKNRLYMTDWWNYIRKIDLPSGEEIQRLRFNQARIWPYSFIKAGELAYLGCIKSPMVYRLDLNSGLLEEGFLLPDGLRGIHGGAYYQQRLCFVAGGAVYCVDPTTGALIRKVSFGMPVYPILPAFVKDKLVLIDYLEGMVAKRLLVFDPDTLKLHAEVALPREDCGDQVLAAPDGSKVYVALGHHTSDTIKMLVIDATNWQIRKAIQFQRRGEQAGATGFIDGDFDEARRFAYIAGFNAIHKIHIDTDELLAVFKTDDIFRVAGRSRGWGATGLCGLKLSAAKDKLFVVSGDAHCMYTYDLAQDRWLPDIVNLRGYCLTDVVMSSDRRYLYSANSRSDTVTMVDVAARKVVQIIGPLKGPTSNLQSVANAASYYREAVAPGEIVAIRGDDIGPPAVATLQLDSTGRVHTELGRTRVYFDQAPAPLLYARWDQINAVVPYSVAGKPSVRVRIECAGEATGQGDVPVAESAPGLFTADSSGVGQAAVLNQDGTLNRPGNPATRGSVIVLYATGEGQTDPSGVDGKVATGILPRPRLPVKVYIQGREAEVLYAGVAPGLVAGVMQVNIRLPMDIPSDDRVTVLLVVGNAISQPGVTIAVR